MAAAPVKSQPLHNFTLPSFLKWGGGKNLSAASTSRCRRSPLSGDSTPPPPPPPPHADHSEPESDRNDSESEFRAHRIGSRAARNRFSLSSCATTTEKRRRVAAAAEEKEIVVESEEAAAAEKKRECGGDEREETVQKPWNLRPRRGVTSSKAPAFDQNGELQETLSPARAIAAAQQGESQPKSLRLRGFNETVGAEKKEKRKFWIALSREEIEEDIFVMTGSRPARRPRKRPKNVQKQLDNVFPGLWLVGVTADAYRVAENPSKR